LEISESRSICQARNNHFQIALSSLSIHYRRIKHHQESLTQELLNRLCTINNHRLLYGLRKNNAHELLPGKTNERLISILFDILVRKDPDSLRRTKAAFQPDDLFGIVMASIPIALLLAEKCKTTLR